MVAAGYQRWKIGAVAVVLQERHAEGHRPHSGAIGRDERPQQAVPLPEKAQDGERDEGRHMHRHDDLEQDAPFAGAVDAGRVDQFIRGSGERLAHQENAEATDRKRDDEALIRVQPAEVPHQDICGMTMTMNGTIIVMMTIENMIDLPGKSYFARA